MNYEMLEYAELLLNIKSISVVAQIVSPTSQEVSASISADDHNLIVGGMGFTLPFSVAKKFRIERTLNCYANEPQHLEARIPISLPPDLHELASDAYVPWAGSDLDKSFRIGCGTCSAHSLIPAGIIQRWQDLPSSGWAEMMDFWHCHKPPEPQTSKHGAVAEAKGYGAGSRIEAQRGLGLVGPLEFLLHADDCQGVEITKNTISCCSCHTPIGTASDISPSTLTLHKHALSTSRPVFASGPYTRYAEHWTSAHMLNALETSGARKLLLKLNPSMLNDKDKYKHSDPYLFLWIMTPDLYISAGRSKAQTPKYNHRAMKVLHQPLPELETRALDNKTDVEELQLPLALERTLLEGLEASNGCMPEKAKTMGPWRVGFLERFETPAITMRRHENYLERARVDAETEEG